jgi:hypothetical protein
MPVRISSLKLLHCFKRDLHADASGRCNGVGFGIRGNGTDSSGASNTATLQNGATYTPEGKFGQALLLDGNNQYAS